MGMFKIKVTSGLGQIPVKIVVYGTTKAQVGIAPNGSLEIRLGGGIGPDSLPATSIIPEATGWVLTMTEVAEAGPIPTMTIPEEEGGEHGNNWTGVARKRRGRKLTMDTVNSGEESGGQVEGGIGGVVGEVGDGGAGGAVGEVEQDEYAERDADISSQKQLRETMNWICRRLMSRGVLLILG